MNSKLKLPLVSPQTHKVLTDYPLIDQIPWLFPDPKLTLADWRGRSSVLLDQLELEIENLKKMIKAASSELTRERLDHVRKLKIQNIEMLRQTLEPLKPSMKINPSVKKAMGYRLPLRQGLLGYFPNLIRDWCADFQNENEALFAATNSILNDVKPVRTDSELRILVLGAGGARLAYDIAKTFSKSLVVAFDLNPILLLAAKKLNEGRKIKAVDAAFSPKNPREPGRIVELSAPAGPADNLSFVFGDVYALPFEAGFFDIVITPWLIDILPRRFEDLCKSVARVTKPGGVWINSGSWHFDFQNEAENLSVEEAVEIAAPFGWFQRATTQIEIPYLQSKFDSHRRFETLTQFCWERNRVDLALEVAIDDREPWIRQTSLAVPALQIFTEQSATHATMALVLSLVDGQRTLADIAAIVATENGLSAADALDATATFFDRFIKDRRFR